MTLKPRKMRTQVEQVRKNDYEKTENYEKYNTDERTR